jgi:hypothetical protein
MGNGDRDQAGSYGRYLGSLASFCIQFLLGTLIFLVLRVREVKILTDGEPSGNRTSQPACVSQSGVPGLAPLTSSWKFLEMQILGTSGSQSSQTQVTETSVGSNPAAFQTAAPLSMQHVGSARI